MTYLTATHNGTFTATFESGLIIDHIFVRDLEVVSAEVLKTESEGVSDHYPLIATIRVPTSLLT